MMVKLLFRGKLVITTGEYERAISTIVAHFENGCIRRGKRMNLIEREILIFR